MPVFLGALGVLAVHSLRASKAKGFPMQFSVWFLPLAIIGSTVLLSIPVGYFLAWVMDGRYRAPAWLKWLEDRINTGPQNWKQYVLSLLLFNAVMFVVGFLFLTLQAALPEQFGNPDKKGMLAPTTIFNTAASFLTNTNLQHYAGEQNLSYTSQLTAILWNMFVSAGIGFCALTAVIRGLRGDTHMGNFYLDMWARRGLRLPAGQPCHGRLVPGVRRADDHARRGDGNTHREERQG